MDDRSSNLSQQAFHKISTDYHSVNITMTKGRFFHACPLYHVKKGADHMQAPFILVLFNFDVLLPEAILKTN